MIAENLLPTPRAKLDEMLERLKKGAAEFARLAIGERIALLERIQENYAAVLEDAVREGTRIKGLGPDGEGEEWFAHGFSLMRHMRLLIQSLRQIESQGAPYLDPSWITERPDGRLAVRAYPLTRLDAMAFPGIQAEVWMEKGIDRAELLRRQASFYKRPHGGKVALVLGAGNVASIPPRDALTKMFNDGTVCVVKMNPVNQYLGPYLEKAFAPAIERGWFAVAYGAGEEGSYLCQHPIVDEIHITGSDKTHDTIVWGPPGPEREDRIRRNDPLLKKEITSELGNVTPVFVVPGAWREDDIAYQGKSIAGMITNNASFNCNAAKLLVQPKGWDRRETLLAAVERALSPVPPRFAYYPGAFDRFKAFTEGRKGLKLVGKAAEGQLPWAIIPDVDPLNAADRIFRNEPWCSLISETALGGSDVQSFLGEAVKFSNEKLWGTLCCTLLVHPETAADPAAAAIIEKAIEQLEYGTVAVNAWGAVGFSLGSTPWGGHPSSTLADIQSGRGWVSNTLMLEGVEKVVVRAKFKLAPKPVWFPDHRSNATLGKRATFMEKEGSWLKLPGVAVAALRG